MREAGRFTFVRQEMNEQHIGHHLSPRKHAVKNVEMTVRRVLQLIRVFEEWEARFNKSGIRAVQDWRDIDPSEYRGILGDDHYGIQPRMELEELWKRYKSGRIYDEVLDLADNLILEKLPDNDKTKEMKRDLARIRKARSR